MQAHTVRAQSDMALVAQLQADGDEVAFAELVRRYADRVYSTCLRVLGDAALAEDATQETFFKLLTHRQQVRESIGGWLHRAATRLSIDRIRRDARRRNRERAYSEIEQHRRDPGAAGAAGVMGGAADQAEAAGGAVASWSELSPHIDAALDALETEARQVLVGHFLHERTLTELADELGVSKATMSRRCRAALDQLRAELARRGVAVHMHSGALAGLLAAGTLEAAPSALVGTLRKMALAGGSMGTAAGAGAGAAGVGASVMGVLAGLSWRGLALAGAGAGVMAVCAMIVLVPASSPGTGEQSGDTGGPAAQAPDAVPSGGAPAPAADAGARTGAGADGDGTPAVGELEAGHEPTSGYLVLPEAAGSFESRHVTMFEDPSAARGGEVAAVFGDGRVERIGLEQLRATVEAQTGESFEDVVRTSPRVDGPS